MTHDTPNSQRPPRKVGPLAIAALLAGGLFQPLLPAFAAGTAANTQISNTATATYSDTPGGTSIPATSNTVSVTVAEVAGLTAVPSGFNDQDGGAVESGDTLEFTFDITNVGNTATDVFIPGLDNLINENFVPTTVQIVDATGTVLATVPAAGGQLSALIAADVLDPDEVLKVRITGSPAAGTVANAPVGVTLGNTGPNNNTASTQNQPDTGDSDPATGNTNPGDIRTVNIDDPGVPGTDEPVNGEREASAQNSIPFASSVTPLALAQVTKLVSTLAPGPTGAATDDLITYDLGLNVLSTSPNAAFLPEDLEGTDITIDGGTESQILVADAIPAGTTLQAVSPAPSGWEVVYSIDDPATTTTVVGATGTAAAWTRTAPTLNTVRRIGFIPTTAVDQLAAGSTVTGFQFTVETTALPATGGQVANIAQVFGQTFDDPAVPGTPTDEIVYDESGDSNPNNFDDSTPPDPTGSNYDPAVDSGVADPVNHGVDLGGDNTGSGPKGEDIVVNIGDAAGTDDILNGPNGVPGAAGPTDDNDDFINQTTAVPPGTLPTDNFDPAPVVFNNTVQNPASTGFIADVTLEPISPSDAETNDDNPAVTGQYGAAGDIPVGTEVTITATDEFGVVQVAVYTWDGTDYTLDSSSTGGTPDGTAKPVNVGNVPAGTTVDYTTTVDLPLGTATNPVLPNDEIPIAIVAFPDDDPVGTPGYTGETTNNITIDRLYTGFMKLTKEAQILDANGLVVQAWTDDQAVLDGVDVQPDYQIEYRITYENISTPANTGNGNSDLTAFDFEIVEAGDVAVGTATNSWAATTDHEQNTSADQGDVQYFTNSADVDPNFFTTADPVAGTKVDKYENEVGQVDPGQVGTFQFRRRIK